MKPSAYPVGPFLGALLTLILTSGCDSPSAAGNRVLGVGRVDAHATEARDWSRYEADVLLTTDLDKQLWCVMVDGWVGSWPAGHCESDGIVAGYSQEWLGADVWLHPGQIGGPAHTEETIDPSIIARIRTFVLDTP